MMKRLFSAIEPHVEAGASVALLLLLAVAALGFCAHQVLSVAYPYPLDYGEAPLVDQAMRMVAGQQMQSVQRMQFIRGVYRRDISSPPYTISNYPPLYVLTLTPFVGLFGPNFWAGRAISTTCALASGAALALIIHTHTRDRLAAAISGLLFLAVPYVVHWSSLLRIDLLALACSLVGLYFLVRWPSARWSMISAGLLLLAAIYTRQSYALAAPLAAFVWLLVRDWRRALGLAALVGGLAVALLLILNTVTRGGFFFHVVVANVNEFGIERLQWNLRQLCVTAPILLLLGAGSLFIAPGRQGLWPLLAPYLVGAALSGLTIGKIGSNVNYFLELSATLSLAAGALVARSRERPWLRIVLLVLLASQVVQLMRITVTEYGGRLAERLEFREEIRELDGIVADAEGPVLADEYMGLLTLQGRALVVQPFEVTQLARAGLWDQTPLVDAIRDREFPLILIHYFPEYAVYRERWTSEMLTAVQHNYAPSNSLAHTVVYRPVGGGTSSKAPRACPGAPWLLPTDSALGVQWSGGGLDFFGRGNVDSVPVYAVADGLLTRLPEWTDSVAIRHDDPLHTGESVWSVYAHMAGTSGGESLVVQDFPPGSVGVPVSAGELLGYQGTWSGQPMRTMWMHVRFAVVRAGQGGEFPAELGPGVTLDPAHYLGIAVDADAGTSHLRPLRCLEQTPQAKNGAPADLPGVETTPLQMDGEE